MPRLPSGSAVTITLVIEGRVRLSYAARVRSDDGTRVVVEAPYSEAQPRDLGYVVLDMDDTWIEHYWRDRWFAVKQIRSATGVTKGWYCDVTRPAVVTDGRIVSDDLYLDLWVSGDTGTILRLDEDEFAESGLAERDPVAAAHALAALDELERHARSGSWTDLLDGDRGRRPATRDS